MRCRFVPELRDVRAVTLALLASMTLPSLLGAQSSCPTIDTTPPFAWCRVERRPVLRAGNAIPSFPVSLQSAQLEGEVRLELIVNDNGEIEPANIHLLGATHYLFADAVRQSVRSWRFEPAEREGQWVPVRLALDVDFLLPPADSVPRREITRIDSTRGGLRIRTGWEAIPFDSTTVADSAAIHQIVASALRALAPINDASGAVCLTWRRAGGSELPAPVVTTLGLAGSPLRTGVGCALTYASTAAPRTATPPGSIMQQGSVMQQGTASSMHGLLGARGSSYRSGSSYRRPVVRPPSPIDVAPLRVEIGDLRPWAPDVYTFRGTLARGANAWTYQCDARRAAANAEWQTRCRRASTP